MIKLLNLFLNFLLGTYKCPAILMYLDLAVLLMPLKNLQNKLKLYHHIKCLPVSALVYKVPFSQVLLKMPGLHEEVADFLAKYEVTDIQ